MHIQVALLLSSALCEHTDVVGTLPIHGAALCSHIHGLPWCRRHLHEE